ncbi:hypothetical protein L210DRAFT_936306 [Boletus edulis BED1]|uniref:Uncharacterized protein n=1 Tax=Boletus edulis BED1 TaxID=1328754 RepID=A0AAD4GI00_BOLED|nr:hypothetical protein L210DRAFT_936306 [Boletus edulis BED1]
MHDTESPTAVPDLTRVASAIEEMALSSTCCHAPGAWTGAVWGRQTLTQRAANLMGLKDRND